MRRHKDLLCFVCIFLVSATCLADSPATELRVKTDETSSRKTRAIVTGISQLPPVPAAEAMLQPLNLITQDMIFNSAYLNTFRLLSEDNPCSRFFGGSIAALEVLNDLIVKLKKTYLNKGIGIQMSGQYKVVVNVDTGNSYRLFEQAAINMNGPFYRHQAISWQPNVGSFLPATNEARVLMLLHELAHLMKGPDGQWLIADDGRELAQSDENTRTIERHCSEQIKTLAK
jgi:hypothetical protein